MHSKWMQISRLPPPVPLGIESMRVSKMRGPTAAMPGQAPSVSTTVGSNTHHGAPSSGGAPGAYYGGDQIDRRGAASSRSETPDRTYSIRVNTRITFKRLKSIYKPKKPASPSRPFYAIK